MTMVYIYVLLNYLLLITEKIIHLYFYAIHIILKRELFAILIETPMDFNQAQYHHKFYNVI